MNKIESAITWMESTAQNDLHGYDQQYRWGEKGDYDCSSAVITAWENAGVPVKTNGATYTGNMYSVFKKCGFSDVTSKVNLSTGSGLQRGDVLLNKKRHTAMYCGNGKEVEASINEKGKAIGGKAGDQTGKEFLIRSYRNYPWDCVLRYTSEEVVTSPTKTVSNTSPKGNNLIYTGQVESVNFTGHHITLDGQNGVETKKQRVYVLQHGMNLDYKVGLDEDGEFGILSKEALGNHYVQYGEVQYMVTACQILLYLNGYDPKGVDGEFGNNTKAAVVAYQRAKGMTPLGICDRNTFISLVS